MRNTAFRELDPIGTVMSKTGMTRLQVLQGIKAAMVERHAAQIALDPKGAQAMKNLTDAIAIEMKRG